MKILFYPDRIDNLKRFSRMYRLLKDRADISFHNNPLKPHDLHVFWSYTRHSITPDSITLNAPNVINRGCWDISKEKVNRIFDDLFVDPLKHKGVCVEKYDRQGRHSMHRLVNCPISPKKDYVYQKYIKSQEDGMFVRYRVIWMDKITHIMKIYQSDAFESRVIKVEEARVRDVFTKKQEADFERKCKAFGVNLAEMDVLIDDKPVVIDVNNIVGGSTIRGYNDTEFAERIDNAVINYLWKKSRS
jgi:hypothetical protein